MSSLSLYLVTQRFWLIFETSRAMGSLPGKYNYKVEIITIIFGPSLQLYKKRNYNYVRPREYAVQALAIDPFHEKSRSRKALASSCVGMPCKTLVAGLLTSTVFHGSVIGNPPFPSLRVEPLRDSLDRGEGSLR